jgi:hypothetical protein
LDKKTFNHSTPLEEYVTSRSHALWLTGHKTVTRELRHLLLSQLRCDFEIAHFRQGKKELSFSKLSITMQNGALLLFSRIHNKSFTKNEDQKHCLLQLVSWQRMLFPTPTKAALTALAGT